MEFHPLGLIDRVNVTASNALLPLRRKPDWEILGIPKARHLTAVVWKQRKLEKMGPENQHELIEALKHILLGWPFTSSQETTGNPGKELL